MGMCFLIVKGFESALRWLCYAKLYMTDWREEKVGCLSDEVAM